MRAVATLATSSRRLHHPPVRVRNLQRERAIEDLLRLIVLTGTVLAAALLAACAQPTASQPIEGLVPAAPTRSSMALDKVEADLGNIAADSQSFESLVVANFGTSLLSVAVTSTEVVDGCGTV
ncbi:MAG: hypothetical protein HY682_07295, partial [Chloroflexi bacterium]|nr:hypothetical protein [Chloroflexota bacterium]